MRSFASCSFAVFWISLSAIFLSITCLRSSLIVSSLSAPPVISSSTFLSATSFAAFSTSKAPTSAVTSCFDISSILAGISTMSLFSVFFALVYFLKISSVLAIFSSGTSFWNLSPNCCAISTFEKLPTNFINTSLCSFHGRALKAFEFVMRLKMFSSISAWTNSLNSFSLFGYPLISNSLTLPWNSVIFVPRFFLQICFCTFFSTYSSSPKQIVASTLISTLLIMFPALSLGRISKLAFPRESFPKRSHVNASNTVVFPEAFTPPIAVFSPKLISLSLQPLKFCICIFNNLMFFIYILHVLLYNEIGFLD